MPPSQLPCRGRQQKTQAALTPCGGGQTWEERLRESSLSVQFGLVRFVKSRSQNRRECAKQTRKSRDQAQSAQWNERCGESVLRPVHLPGRRFACSRQVAQFHVPWRQPRSSLFQLLVRTSALHRICSHGLPIPLWNGCYARNSDSSASPAMHSSWEWLVFLRVPQLFAMTGHQDTREITCLS